MDVGNKRRDFAFCSVCVCVRFNVMICSCHWGRGAQHSFFCVMDSKLMGLVM